MNLMPVLKEKGIIREPAKLVAVTVPEKPKEMKFTVAEVLKLKGDATRGKTAAARCVMCHQVEGNGVDYGPALKGFGKSQPAEIVARAIVDPSFDISHGFEGRSIHLKNGVRIDGVILADGETLKIRSTGGTTQEVPKEMIKKREDMKRSLMLSADEIGLTAQDVADIVEWMKTH
jgi:putative heme-binding domain-containing protein